MPMVYCVVYGGEGEFNLIAIFREERIAKAYIERTKGGVFSHLQNLRVLAQELY